MTPKQERIVALYESGMSCREIGLQIGVTRTAVSNMLKRAKVQARPKADSATWDARKEEIEYLYFQQNMSQKQIAEYFGSHQTLIGRVMRRLGIERLSVGRRAGPANHKYKDGKSSRLYRTVITKDKCRKCGTTDDLGIHHKNDDHYDNRLENLEVLCNRCHMSETKRKWWAAKKAGLPTPKSNAPQGWNRR
jgi:IS30 family transposase